MGKLTPSGILFFDSPTSYSDPNSIHITSYFRLQALWGNLGVCCFHFQLQYQASIRVLRVKGPGPALAR